MTRRNLRTGRKAGPRLAIAAGAGLLLVPLAAAAQAAPAALPLQYESPDGRLRIKPKTRLFLDAAGTFDASSPGLEAERRDVRTFYVGVEGKLDAMTFTLIGDFSGDEPALRSAYVAWTQALEAGDLEITLGNRLSERGLEGSSSSEGLPFIERNAVAGALAPQKGLYGMGLTVKLFGDGWHVASQIAGDDVNRPELTEGAVAAMVRAHWNPPTDGDARLHLGGWAYHEALTSDLKAVSRNTNWVSPVTTEVRVSLGTLAEPERTEGLGGEIGLVRGPAWAFAEFGQRRIVTASLAADVRAWAVSAGWTLAGAPSAYSARSGTFVRTAPDAPLSRGGLGSWEIAGRVQHLDNTDAPLGGAGEDVTLGLTWRMESWMRLMLNASHWRVEARAAEGMRADEGEALLARLQVAF